MNKIVNCAIKDCNEKVILKGISGREYEYPEQMLCKKHLDLVNKIMDKFKEKFGEKAYGNWTKTEDWNKWIEENKRERNFKK